MAELPVARLSPYTRPFTFTGIDYFGPFFVSVGRRTEKRWGVLFTCMTTRAVHIEVAHALTTSACILVVRNFVCRRGTPNEFFSDRGTNFVGANRELQEAITQINEDELVEKSGIPDTTWNFNPPSAPHFGGAWERLVQSVKRTLAGIQLTNRPTDAVLQNWLIEVECILNTRPLTDVPVDREEDAPLTPNHFLVGSSAGAKPLVPLNDSIATIRSSWKTSQRYADHFWKRWITAYLPTLTKRSKWHQTSTSLKEGDLVVIVDESLPRGCWPKGRILQAIPSKDGQIRKVHVQTAWGKILQRPAVKVARLDIEPQTVLTHAGRCCMGCLCGKAAKQRSDAADDI
uniref:Integrase catalytic domain-containing protein n=1 Tax=Anopheles atroparvus TaxID=41427 RepID=A0AAG5DR31_ANOAO